MADEEISYIARQLYDWTSEKSCWVFQAQGADVDIQNPAMLQVQRIYEQMGTKGYARPLETFRHAIQPWHPDEKDFVSLLEWHGFDQTEMSKEDRDAWGPAGVGYGAYLVK